MQNGVRRLTPARTGFAAFGLIGLVFAARTIDARARPSSDRRAYADSIAIRSAIERGARGFANGEPDSILAHYAPDIVLSYPGTPDQNYATLALGYGELRRRPASVTATTTPTFDEILVGHDLAVVRVRWTTIIRVAATDTLAARQGTRYLRDLQVWRRGRSGEWQFIRGMHYPDSTARPIPQAK
jgi:hypothetical protein